MDNIFKCWEVVAWKWLRTGVFDNVKYVTLDFGTGSMPDVAAWIRNKEMSEKVYRFLTGVDMARKHGISLDGKRVRRCVALRGFAIRGVTLDEEMKSQFEFWFGNDFTFMEERAGTVCWGHHTATRLSPSIMCEMQPL